MRPGKTLHASVAIAALAAVLVTPAAANATTYTVSCDSTGTAGTLMTYECDLYAPGATNESWQAPDLNRASQGTPVATGECRPQTNPAYYYSVNVFFNIPGTTTLQEGTTLFSCPNEL
jgi:hypothetical protein